MRRAGQSLEVNQDIAVRVMGASAIISACACTSAISRSRSKPSAGGIGAGGISA
jgi:hypothetical protein